MKYLRFFRACRATPNMIRNFNIPKNLQYCASGVKSKLVFKYFCVPHYKTTETPLTQYTSPLATNSARSHYATLQAQSNEVERHSIRKI